MSLALQEGMRIILKLTPARIWNMLLLKISFLLSKSIKKPVHWGNPMAISIEPTTSCNLRCPECPSGLRSFTRPTGMLSFDQFKRILDSVHQHLSYLTLYFQGEPYLNPDFIKMVRYAHTKNIFTATSSNGHFLDEDNCRQTVMSGLDKLIISIDGTDQESYEKYRKGGRLQRVLEGTKNLIDFRTKAGKKYPIVIFQFLVLRYNQHQISEINKLAKQYNVDYLTLKTAQINDFRNGSDLIPDIQQFSRYEKQEDGTYTLKNKYEDHCWRMWSSCVITWDGKIVPCCFDKDAKYRLGNLKDTDFRAIWKGNEYNDFRAQILRSRSEIDICANCTEGTKVWV